MAQNTLIPVTEARARLADLIDELDGERVVFLLRRSRPAAVLMAPEHYDELLRTIEELDDQASVLYAQLHPEENISQEKLEAELGLMG